MVSRTAVLVFALLAPIASGCGGDGNGKTGKRTAQATVATTTGKPSAALAAKAKRLIPIASQSQAVASSKESIRIANAQGELLVIAQKDPAAIAPLTAALKEPDYDLVTDLYNFFIQLGQPGSEKVLIEALNRQGFSERSSPMAFAFLASGNKKLVAGTRRWADHNGLTITGQPSGVGPKWGQVGLPVPTGPTAPPPSP